MNMIKMSNMERIRLGYQVPAKRGGIIKFEGKRGVIVGSRNQYLRVLLDGEKKSKLLHPTWFVTYESDLRKFNMVYDASGDPYSDFAVQNAVLAAYHRYCDKGGSPFKVSTENAVLALRLLVKFGQIPADAVIVTIGKVDYPVLSDGSWEFRGSTFLDKTLSDLLP